MYYKNRKLTKRAGVLQTLMSGGGAGAAALLGLLKHRALFSGLGPLAARKFLPRVGNYYPQAALKGMHAGMDPSKDILPRTRYALTSALPSVSGLSDYEVGKQLSGGLRTHAENLAKQQGKTIAPWTSVQDAHTTYKDLLGEDTYLKMIQSLDRIQKDSRSPLSQHVLKALLQGENLPRSTAIDWIQRRGVGKDNQGHNWLAGAINSAVPVLEGIHHGLPTFLGNMAAAGPEISGAIRATKGGRYIQPLVDVKQGLVGTGFRTELDRRAGKPVSALSEGLGALWPFLESSAHEFSQVGADAARFHDELGAARKQMIQKIRGASSPMQKRMLYRASRDSLGHLRGMQRGIRKGMIGALETGRQADLGVPTPKFLENRGVKLPNIGNVFFGPSDPSNISRLSFGAAPRSQGLGTQAASAMSQFSKNVSPKTRGYLKKVPFVGGFFRHKPISPEANLRYARMNSNLRQKRLDNYRENVQQNLAQMPTGFL